VLGDADLFPGALNEQQRELVVAEANVAQLDNGSGVAAARDAWRRRWRARRGRNDE
jgi:hypothetical protein